MADLKAGPLRERAVDEAFTLEVLDEMHALESADMTNEVLTEFLGNEPPPLDWQIGEALAEVLLDEWHGAIWVWNGSRDRKTAKASLPGADLVGFVNEGGQLCFLFGEVKSSRDATSPPNVLYGRTGLVDQLERLCSAADHWSLIKWLRSRCTTDDERALFREALKRYLRTRTRGILLVGCLVRDTAPAKTDIEARARTLSASVVAPARAALHVWYLPIAMAQWPTLVEAAA